MIKLLSVLLLITFVVMIVYCIRPLYLAARDIRKHDKEQEDPLEAYYKNDFQ